MDTKLMGIISEPGVRISFHYMYGRMKFEIFSFLNTEGKCNVNFSQ